MQVVELMDSVNQRRGRGGRDGRGLQGRRRRGGGFALSYRAGKPGWFLDWNWVGFGPEFEFSFSNAHRDIFSFYNLSISFLQCPVSEKLLQHFPFFLSSIICIYIFPSAPFGKERKGLQGEDETRRRYGAFFFIGDHWRRLYLI